MLYKFIRFVIWFVVTLVITTMICNWLTAANDILVLIGIISALVYLVITVKTKCFLNFKFNFKRKTKDEKVP